MNHNVEQTQTQVNASAEELKQQAIKLKNEITTAKENIRTEAFSKSNAEFMQTFDADFGNYLNTIEQAATDIIEVADKMIKVAAEQQATANASIQI